MAMFSSDPADPRDAQKRAARTQLLEAYYDVVERNDLTPTEAMELAYDLMGIPVWQFGKEERNAKST